jgi:DUF1680 family protein
MNKAIRIFILIPLLTLSFTSCIKESDILLIKTGGPEVVSFRALQFPLRDVRLLDGPFKHATDLDVQTLLGYDPDRFLARYYKEAGLKPKTEQYHGWEDETIAGHSLGHYLSAISMMYQTTGDKRFIERAEYIVSELKRLQDTDGNGYIGAFPNGKRILSEEVAKGNIRSQGFDLNGIWVPFYTEHKMMAGLRDAYHLCSDTLALTVEKRFADWLEGIVITLNDEQVQKMLRCEHGGIAEVLADLYADTKDTRYLRMAELFYQKAILDPLKKGQDILPGKHCNTNIPKLIGLSRIYELTGDTTDRKAAEFFWKTVVYHHSYVTGGNGNNEYFGPADKLRNMLGEETTESCNVYNMLKLTEHLFEWKGDAASADFYERALFNHILSTQNPIDGRVTYNLSLDMGGFKNFQDPLDFTCCIGTGMENHSKYGRNIYYHADNELFLFQYIASELNWREKGVTVIQKTGFPEEQATTLEFKVKNPVRLKIYIRYPYWAVNGIVIKVNNNVKRVSGKPGSFVGIKRIWKSGDRLEIKLPFTLRLEEMPDDSNRVAIMYGPMVLAGDLGPLRDSLSNNPMYVPVMMKENRDPSKWIRLVKGKINTFLTVNTGRPRDVELRPFYTFYDRRYSIYWDLFTEIAWKECETEYLTEQENAIRIKKATIDFVQPGEMQPERDHNFKGEKTSPGSFRERANRESREGWFSYDLKSGSGNQVALVVEYWGGFPGAKTFDILVNEKVISTENISGKKDGQFVSVRYDIPEDLTKGKSRITVKFKAHEGNMAGPVFGVRIIKKEAGN